MKHWLAVLIIALTFILGTTSFAASPAPTQEETRAALEILKSAGFGKTVHVVWKMSSAPERTLLVVGSVSLSLAAVSATSFAASTTVGSLFNLPGKFSLVDAAMERLLLAGLVTGYASGIGVTVVLLGAVAYETYEHFIEHAQAAELDCAIVSSDKAMNWFFEQPVSEQMKVVGQQTSVAVVALAGSIVRASATSALPIGK